MPTATATKERSRRWRSSSRCSRSVSAMGSCSRSSDNAASLPQHLELARAHAELDTRVEAHEERAIGHEIARHALDLGAAAAHAHRAAKDHGALPPFVEETGLGRLLEHLVGVAERADQGHEKILARHGSAGEARERG